jgi:hypothetical protein
MTRNRETRSTFTREGQWYKGNLHCHSTLSDGRLTLDELVREYRARGYHFLATSEHNVFTDAERMNSGDFILLPAIESNFKLPDEDYRCMHLNIFAGTDEMLRRARRPLWGNGEAVEPLPFSGADYHVIQGVIDEAVDRGCIVMFNHPHWSINELHDIMPLCNLFAVEVYNHSSEHLENMGESDIVWESLLRAGKRMWATAVDDNHDRFPVDSPFCDSFGGWVVVKAGSLSRDHVIQALIDGSFYASTGPEIYRFDLEGDTVTFECSPVQRIHLVGDRRQYQTEVCELGANKLTSFTRKLIGTEKYIRVECADAWGRRAYTNPIFLE